MGTGVKRGCHTGGEEVAVEAKGRPIEGGAPGPYKEGYEKVMGVGGIKSLSLLECFRTFLNVSGTSRKCFGSFWRAAIVSGMLRYFASVLSATAASGMFL